MNKLGVEASLKHIPELDPEFFPVLQFNQAFLRTAQKPMSVAVERDRGQVAVCNTRIHGTPEWFEADCYYMDRLVKSLLWMKGGWKVYVAGDEAIGKYLQQTYSLTGARAFDADFMAGVYERPFEVVLCDQVPAEHDVSQAIGRHMDGCRIGFDAGGSDRKVSAVVDGETVFSEEVVWFPKVTADPQYHYDGIVSALKAAAEHMPRVDAVGVSSAGVYINDRTMVASLFLKVPKDEFDAKVKDLYPGHHRHLRRRPLRRVQRWRRIRPGRGHESGGQQRAGHCHGHQRGGGLRGREGQHHRLAQRAGLHARGCERGRHAG